MGESPTFFGEIRTIHNPVAVDIQVPSIVYRNSLTTNIFVLYNNVVNSYVPRILARITKYNVINWVLGLLGIRHEWLLMLLLIIL